MITFKDSQIGDSFTSYQNHQYYQQSQDSNAEYCQTTQQQRNFGGYSAQICHKDVQEQLNSRDTKKSRLGLQTQDKQTSNSKYQAEHKVFFKCLPRTITKEEVLEQFTKYGRVLQLRLPYSKKKQKYIGYGYVVFEQEMVAVQLIKITKQLVLGGKPINLQAFNEIDVVKR